MNYLFLLLLISTQASAQLVGDTQNGLASYLDTDFDGVTTAYDLQWKSDELVAAHRTYPVGSTVEVRNMDNGKSVRVKVIDKGPFIRGRIIEVSRRAARMLDMLDKLTVPVEIELVALAAAKPRREPTVVASASSTPEPVVVATPPAARPEPKPTPTTATPAPTNPAPAASPKPTQPAATVTPAAKPVAPVRTGPAVPVLKLPTRTGKRTDRAETFAPGVYRVQLDRKPAGNYGVQVGSYSDLEGAMDRVARLQAKWFDDILLKRTGTGADSLYKVILGPFTTQAQAKNYSEDLLERYKIKGFTVTLE